MLGKRLLVFGLNDVGALSERLQGAGTGKTARFLEEVHRLRVRPVMFGVEWPSAQGRFSDRVINRAESFDKTAVRLAERGEQ